MKYFLNIFGDKAQLTKNIKYIKPNCIILHYQDDIEAIHVAKLISKINKCKTLEFKSNRKNKLVQI